MLPQQDLHSPTTHSFEVAPQRNNKTVVQRKQSCRAALSEFAAYSPLFPVSHKAPTITPSRLKKPANALPCALTSLTSVLCRIHIPDFRPFRRQKVSRKETYWQRLFDHMPHHSSCKFFSHRRLILYFYSFYHLAPPSKFQLFGSSK